MSFDIETSIDDQQIEGHLSTFNMIKIVDFDPFMHRQTAPLPLS